MLSKSLGWIASAGLVGLAGAGAAEAQTSPAPKPPAKESKTVQGVTVTGEATSGLRISIDRKSYDIAKDLQTTSGSIGDALRNVPSVVVDAQGNISLRGDPNVTILVDGKPSGMFSGPGRAAALQSLPADQVERVEVITNPSADLSPEGTAGVINLITKQVRKPGLAGTVRGAMGSEARQTAGASLAYNTGRLSLSGDITARRDPQKYTVDETRSGADAGGQPFASHSLSQGRGRGHIETYRFAGDYDLDKATRMSAEVRRTDVWTRIGRRQAFEGEIPGDASRVAFEQDGPLQVNLHDSAATLGYRRTLAGDGHSLSVQLRFEETDNDYRQSAVLSGQPPPGPSAFNASRQLTTQGQTQLKVDYARPMPADGKLKAGLDWRRDDDLFHDFGLVGASATTALADPNQTNRFHYVLTVNAAYASYEQPFGDLTVLGGLRLEDARIETHEFSGGAQDSREDVSAYPSLHLAWKLSDAQQITASYSRRIQRPFPNWLDPFASVNNLIYRAGNPALEPQRTDSYEAGWQHRQGGENLLATLFWRDSRGVIVDVTTVRPDGGLLLTKENVGRSRSAGLELSASGKLTRTLGYNVTATAAHNDYDAANLGFRDRRRGTTLSGQMSLNWQPTTTDFAQVSGYLVGERLTAQGHGTPFGALNLGYRHKLTEQLSLVITGANVLPLVGRDVVDTPALHDVTKYRNDAKGYYIGFSYAFGGRKAPADQGFDFGGGPGR